jgi:FkbH-like protein
MTCELSWLPAVTDADRHELASAGQRGAAEVQRLRALAGRRWDEGQLRSIGRKLRKATAADAERVEAERLSGYVPFSLLIISSSTSNHLLDPLAATALRAGILLRCQVAEYEEPESWLAQNAAILSNAPPDATLLALDRKALHLDSTPGDAEAAQAVVTAALDRVFRLVDQVKQAAPRTVILQTVALEASDNQLSMDEWLPGSTRRVIREFNRQLAARARERACLLFDVAAIADLVGHATWSAGRYWFVAKLPFAPVCVPLYAHRLMQLVAAALGKSRRVLVLDLDETLWGGIVGDDGVAGLVLGAGNARGEAHAAIQRMALQLKERGVILCVASKNTEEVALEAFRTHPEMLIRESDLALYRINWDDKAANIVAMAEALDLGLESFVFVDDNPVERKRVREALPAVAVPELPEDPAGWVPVIQSASYFEQLSFTAEDRARTQFYLGNAKRKQQSQSVSDPREFLASLKMVLRVARFDALGRSRIAQLISKSNQFNLTTRRYSEAEVAALEAAADIEPLQLRLEDSFGDNGMICVLICRKHARYWEIDTWIMSCRVLGRGVEQCVLALIADRAHAAGAEELRGTYIPTAKNGIVREHYARLGFTQTGSLESGATTWSLSLKDFVPPSTFIEVVGASPPP